MSLADNVSTGPTFFGIGTPQGTGAPGSVGADRPSPPAQADTANPYQGQGSLVADPALQSYEPTAVAPGGPSVLQTGAGTGTVVTPPHPNAMEGAS